MSTSIAQLLTYPNKTPVDAVQGQIVEVYKGKIVSNGKHCQEAKIRDAAGTETKLTVWEHDDISTYKGRDVILQSGARGGLTVNHNTWNGATTVGISASKTATFQFLEVHRANTGQPATAPTTATTTTNAHPTQAATVVVNGAKVGMSINCATEFMVKAGEAFSEQRIWEIASALIRVSNRMETGDLAPAVADEEIPY